jgi:anti-sigma B factor antagonist
MLAKDNNMDFKTEIFDQINQKPNDVKLEGEYFNGDPGTLVVKISGSLDTYNSHDFRIAVNEAIKESPKLKIVVFDMESLNYVSSTGVGSVIDIFMQSQKSEVDVYLYRMCDKINEIFNLLGFINYFKLITEYKEIGKEKQTVFPKIINCPHCNAKLKLLKAGKFRCSSCKGGVRVTSKGEVQSS